MLHEMAQLVAGDSTSRPSDVPREEMTACARDCLRVDKTATFPLRMTFILLHDPLHLVHHTHRSHMVTTHRRRSHSGIRWSPRSAGANERSAMSDCW